ncbi:cation channel sperm-associated auxiliary subunit epsilon isoform X3 [Anolis carolinensis]|uniref:cation channel sperm-associated auxiliary subunit epsilon isoform X3 n=1 Tax=Anolis carolinensis TaxID=28377 RepID=UPI002F2B7A13
MARRTEPCLRRKKRQPSSSHGGWGTGKARTASTFSPSLRYATNTGDYLIFSTRTTIYLEFEGTTFREWNIPPLCTVGDKTMQRTTLHCSVPGTHQIGPVVTVPSPDDEERFLSIIADVNCFMWYIHQDVHRLSKKFSVQHLHAWIFDPENAEGSEINHTATSPPIYSKTLSKQFWNWGESPTISTFFGQKMYTAPLYNDGIWTHRVPTLSNDNIAMIFGKAVTFQDCFILDTPFVIAQPVQHLSNPAYIPVTSPPGSLAQVTWAACFPLTAVLVTDFGIFFTSDGFLNTEIIKIPAKILNTTLYNSVNDVAIAFPNVFILIGDMLYKASEYEIIKIGSGHNVPDSKIIGVQAKTWCSAEYPSITITFYHEEDYSKVFDYESSVILAQGVVTVEIQPSSAGKTCDKKVKLTHLRVGCSPEKRIEVAGKPTECENITFTIPWSSLINPTKEEDVEINYDIKTYGCPLEVDYEETFRPTVLLYMGERAIGTVEANYVLWEMNGRNDFNYNSTMEQVRCLNTAQTWQKAIEKINRTSSLTPDEVESLWGPRNYRSCFDSQVDEIANLDTPYEILNHSGMNSIIWPLYYNGIYLFRLRILDPNYSFCKLNTFFAVRTVGIIERPRWLPVAAWITVIMILLLSVLLFTYFTYVKSFRALNVDPLMSFDQEFSQAAHAGKKH